MTSQSPDAADDDARTAPHAGFTDVADAAKQFQEAGYLTDDRLATTVFLLTRMSKPVLLEGPAGVGKTQLATSLAQVTGRRLLRLQCYEGQDETKALYEWDYGKQMLYTQILREKIGQVVEDTTTLTEAVDRIAEQDSVFFSERFLTPRPLLEAITSDEPVVLLIDEVDRADEALEAVLLELLSEFQISIPEVGTVTARHLPYVVLTSNNTRDLSAALKRRCLHLFLDYPTADRELDIIRSKDTGLSESLAKRLVDIVRELREMELRKAPSISETIDWARTLAVLGVNELTSDVLSSTMNVVIKYERDLKKAMTAIPHLVDPNADVPDSLDAGHGHGHGHGHSHDDEGDGGGDGAVTGDVDGRDVRAKRDQPGRHGDNYGGPDASGSKPRSARSAEGGRKVSSSQGERSFARKRPV